jgi:Cyclic nucleotide-binding domain
MKPPSIVLQRVQMLLTDERVERVYIGGLWLRDRLTSYRTPSGKGNNAVNFLRSLAPAEHESFAAVAVRCLYAQGERLMLEGEPADRVMVILSGWTRITTRSASAQRILAERGPGQLVGERAALRRNVRSATVTALTPVTALVMPTEDFATFIAAHPRVLDVVENQIYSRLTEDSRGYAPDSWRGGVPARGAGDTLAVRQAQPLSGENCTIVLTDVVGFGAEYRKDRHRLIIRDEIWAMMEAALGPMWDDCNVEDRGDGMLIVAPPRVPTARIMEGIHRELPSRLRLHNGIYAKPCQFHLRVAANVGPVTTDAHGMAGEAIIHTARLVDAPSLKAAMEETGHGLGIIVSEFVYETAIKHADQFIDVDRYHNVAVSNKEFHGSAWIRLYDLSPLAERLLVSAAGQASRVPDFWSGHSRDPGVGSFAGNSQRSLRCTSDPCCSSPG